MKRALSATITALFCIAITSPAHAQTSNGFGTDWDNPTSAVAPIDRPETESCQVELVDNVFDDDRPFESTYRPDEECGTSWSKVVLDMHGEVSGRQHDRLATLEIGGVPVFKTSTPQPSPEGIEWDVERDLTGYSSLLTAENPVVMILDNTVDAVYTGVFDIQVTLTFYTADEDHTAPNVADRVLPLTDGDRAGADLTGELTVPRNSHRLLADVYATASGGGCEEFWYLTAPPDTGYQCESADGPHREVQVLIDDQLAGIALPYPAVYGGGWSNPFLWYALPAPRAFDLTPLTYDLTPYLGLLNDGEAHEITVRVVGVHDTGEGWSTPVAFRAWQDHSISQVTGGVLMSKTAPLSNDAEVSVTGDETEVVATAGHRHTATGWLQTSQGRILTTVDRVVSHVSTHTFGPDGNPDALDAHLSDVESRTVLGASATTESRETVHNYDIDGHITVDDGRLTTEIALNDHSSSELTSARGTTSNIVIDHSFEGAASWNTDVSREERYAEGTSQSRYRATSDSGGGYGNCYDRQIRTAGGHVTADRRRC